MITLQSFPQGDSQSKYYAVNNPIEYQFLMSGKGSGAFNVYSIMADSVGSGPQSNFVLFEGNLTEIIRAGDIINIAGVLIVNVVSVQFLSGINNTRLVIDKSVSYAEDLLVESINNYRAEFRVFHGRKELGTGGDLIMQQVGVNIEGTPDAEGKLKLNVQPYLKPFIDFQEFINMGKVNTVDRGLWGRFYVQYRERFDGDDFEPENGWIPETVTLANMRWYVSAVKQIKSIGSGSMFPYVKTGILNVPIGEPIPPRINFTTAFKEPEYYVGYPNELSFVWPEVSGYLFLKLKQEKLNPAKNVTATNETVLLTEGRQEVNRLRLGNYSDAGFLRVSLIEDTEPSEGYVQSGYVNVGYFELI